MNGSYASAEEYETDRDASVVSGYVIVSGHLIETSTVVGLAGSSPACAKASGVCFRYQI